MTNRTKIITGYVAAGLVILVLIEFLLLRSFTVTIPNQERLSHVKVIGIALKLYADDNHGLMPNDLNALFPTYLTDKRVMEGIEFVTPGMNLSELPAHTIIARYVYRDENIVSVVHADMSAEAHKATRHINK